VAHDDERPRAVRLAVAEPVEGLEQLEVVVVRQELAGLAQADPPDLVDLLVGDERRRAVGAEHPGAPVRHVLDAAADRVGDVLEGVAEADADAGLLADLADRRRLQGLAGIGLALGERPVVVAGPVDDEDLDPGLGTAGAGLLAPHDAAGRRRDPFACHAAYCPLRT
jgi:hypothetical protein